MKKLALLLGTIALVGAGCTNASVINPPMEGYAPVLDPPFEVNERGDAVNYNGIIDPSTWEYFEQAQRIINETQGRTIDVEQIQRDVVQHPTETNLFYFSTATSDKMQTEVFNGIYEFDTSDLSWERLYKQTSYFENPEAVYHVVGIEGGTLIIRKLPFETELNCGNLWDTDLGEEYSLVRMPIDAPYSKLPPVDMTTEMQDVADAQTVTCYGAAKDALDGPPPSDQTSKRP
jgi:hypothetical protein